MKVWGVFRGAQLLELYSLEEMARAACSSDSYFIKELTVQGVNGQGDSSLLYYSTLSRLNSFQSQLDLIKTCLLRLQDKMDGMKGG